jgi:hypothetical protein
MILTHDQLNVLTDLIEDTAEFYCSQELVSGETFWTCVESLATTKLAELHGELEYSNTL